MTKKRSSLTAKSSSAISIPRGFAEVFSELKQKIQNARLSAAITVNQRLIKLYWEIGKIIFEIQQTQKWGSRDIESLGNELQKEFPGISGFSRSNLFKMRAFYLSYKKVSQTVKQFEELPVSQIPWGHNVILVTKIKDTKERLWYAHLCKTKKQFTAEYALRDIRKPMGVSQYEGITTKSLPKRLQQSLPSIQEIEAELSDSPTDNAKKRPKKKRVKL